MKQLCAILVAAGAACGAAADAPVFVELYTSQGCSSCPPADALLAELAAQPDVIAVSLHVDYWNYLGWADAFAAPEHAKRQKRLARARGERMIYTPQIVVDGSAAVVGSDRAAIRAAVAAAMAAPRRATVTLTPDGDMIRVEVAAETPVEARLSYFIYAHPHSVAIERGENAGQVVDYVNTVRAMMPLGAWSGISGVWRVPVPRDARGVAVIVETDAHGVIAAGRHELAPPSAVAAGK